MRIDPARRSGRFLLAVAVGLVRGVLGLLSRTCRYRVVAGEAHLQALLATPRATVLSFWHARSILAAPWVLDRLHRRGLEVLVLASHSRDGELVSRLAAVWGLAVVRGSASRGGREAVRAIYRAIRHGGLSPVMIPDGPRGPAHHFKVGTAVLAQLADTPILPLGFAPRRALRLRSWDRLFLPLPFTTIAVAVGAPQSVPKGLDSAALERERQRLETLLDAVTREADAAVAARDYTGRVI